MDIGVLLEENGWTEMISVIGVLLKENGWTEMISVIGVLLKENGWTEMISVIGVLLEDSGWTEMIEEDNITTSGRADSHLNCAHVKQSRYAHKATASALYCLMRKGYNLEVDFSEFAREGEKDHNLSFGQQF